MNLPSENKRIAILLVVLFTLSCVWYYQSEILGISLSKTAAALREEMLPPPRDPAPDLVWEKATSTTPWEARDSHAMFIFNDMVWLAGGITGNGYTEGGLVKYWEFPHFNDVWNSRDGLTWTRVVEHAEWPVRRSMSIVPFEGRLWMFGGWSPVGGYQNDVWVSDDGISWRKVVASAPWAKREGQISLVYNGKLFMIGGVNYDLRKTYNDVWSTTDGVTWKEEVSAAPWAPRWDHSVVEYKGKLFLTAGMTIGGKTYADVWSSSDGVTWELATDTPPWASRQGHSLLRYRGKLWLIGRLNDKEDGYGPNDVWFSEDGLRWEKTTLDPEWLGREDHGGLVYQGVMWIMGGMDVNVHWNNDIWFARLP